ncbi:hypothetical protein C8Q70DRAFT_1008460 [Cubamyces menziesii]|uniref:Transmembrane protein n=1 Tax=Trametes cubensis TaxID=1111947 RepID=A0AAD7U302_9APHY|nr:hypothetical protein C8Q70DRAFT_1008460 [Cubamyces menziesii]KAJ8497175.1 hypothetical protein ONZ51_g654 [Trametes cubensis]
MSFVADTSTPTPTVGHLPHVNPTAPATQLSKTHPNIVNYAISAGGVLLGLAIIGVFALIIRCKKGRKKRALDAQIDARIHEETLSRMAAASRMQSPAKMRPAAVTRGLSVAHPMPLMTAQRTSSTAYSSTETLPRTRSVCIRASDQRLPCGCPDCLVLTRTASVAPHVGSPAASSGAGSGTPLSRHGSTLRTPGSPHSAVRYAYASSRLPRVSPSSVRGTGSPGTTVGPRRGPYSPAQRTSPTSSRPRHIRNDENAHREDAIRTHPSPRAHITHREWDTWATSAAGAYSGTTLTYPRGVGMGIMTATSTGTLGCPSPMAPSLAYSTPRMIGSALGSPALSLSDDAGITTISPCTPPPQVSLGSLGTLGSLTRTGASFARSGTASSIGSTSKMNVQPSLDIVLSSGYAGASSGHGTSNGDNLAHMHVSPDVGQKLEAVYVSPRVSPQLASSPSLGERVYTGGHGATSKQRSPQEPNAQHDTGSAEKWFTEVDWFADDGPLPLSCYEQKPSTPSNGATRYDYGGYSNYTTVAI